jgi:hypothetical protein
MEPALKELPLCSKLKDKEKRSDNQAQLFLDSYNETAKISKSDIHASIKALNLMVQQRNQEAVGQLKIIEKLQKIKDPLEPWSHTSYSHKNKSKNKLLREQFHKYQETIDALTKANAQLIAYHQACLEGNRKCLKASIASSKESEKHKQEFEKQCEERRLKEEQEYERLRQERLKQG